MISEEALALFAAVADIDASDCCSTIWPIGRHCACAMNVTASAIPYLNRQASRGYATLEKRDPKAKIVCRLRYPPRRDPEQCPAAVKTDFPYSRSTGRMP